MERVTIQHLEVVRVELDKDLMLIKGAVPGPKQCLITVQGTVKRLKARVIHAPEPSKKEKAKKEAPKAAPAPAAKPKAAGK